MDKQLYLVTLYFTGVDARGRKISRRKDYAVCADSDAAAVVTAQSKLEASGEMHVDSTVESVIAGYGDGCEIARI